MYVMFLKHKGNTASLIYIGNPFKCTYDYIESLFIIVVGTKLDVHNLHNSRVSYLALITFFLKLTLYN